MKEFEQIKKKSKMGQITIFLILCFVLVVAGVGFFFFTSSKKSETLSTNTRQIEIQQAQLEPFVNYMESCIERVSKEGMFLLGKQAGVIYAWQGGTSQNYSSVLEGRVFLKYDGFNVLYNIDDPSGGTNCVVDLPDYPVSNLIPYPYTDWETFGSLPDFNSIKQYEYESCFGKPQSTKVEQMMIDLKSYIEYTVKLNCVFDSFPQFVINSSNVTATVESQSSKTYVTVNYPIIIIQKVTGSKKTIKQFHTVLKMGLKELDVAVNSITKKDTTDPFYDARQSFGDYQILLSPDQFFKDDIIKIKSDNLVLDGKSFEFRFGRKNRAPALEYVYNVSFADVPLEIGYEIKWDDVVHQNISAVDPDEDNVTIKIIIGSFKREILPGGAYNLTFSDVDSANPPNGDGRLNATLIASDGQFEDYVRYYIE